MTRMTKRSRLLFTVLVLLAVLLLLRGWHCARCRLALTSELALLATARAQLSFGDGTRDSSAPSYSAPPSRGVSYPVTEAVIERIIDAAIEGTIVETPGIPHPVIETVTETPITEIRSTGSQAQWVGFTPQPGIAGAPRVRAVIVAADGRRVLLAWHGGQRQWLAEGDEFRGWELVHAGAERVILHGPHVRARVVWTPVVR